MTLTKVPIQDFSAETELVGTWVCVATSLTFEHASCWWRGAPEHKVPALSELLHHAVRYEFNFPIGLSIKLLYHSFSPSPKPRNDHRPVLKNEAIPPSFLHTIPLYHHIWKPLCDLFSVSLLNEPYSPAHGLFRLLQLWLEVRYQETGRWRPARPARRRATRM